MSYIPTPTEQALFAYLEPMISPVPIIYENQDGPRPETVFATLLITSEDRIGEPATELDETAPIGDNFTERAAHLLEVVARVTVYGRESYATARDIVTRWGLPSSATRAFDLGLSIWDVAPARRVPVFLEQVTEDRWIVDIRAYTTATASADGEALEEITATFEQVT